MRPVISVVVPIYNVEKYLERCLDSIFGQSFQNFEVILVNDCTPDNSQTIINEYQSKYPTKIKVLINEQNIGLGASRDRGIKEAEGEYIVFLDSDDYIAHDFFEQYISVLQREQCDIAIGGYYRVENSNEIKVSLPQGTMTEWMYPSVWIRMYRKSFLDSNHLDFRKIRYYEDGIFNALCLAKKPKICFIDYCGYYYICNPESITQNTKKIKLFETGLNNYILLLKEIASWDIDKETLDKLNYVVIDGITAYLLLCGRKVGTKQMKEFNQQRKEFLDAYIPNYLDNPYIGFNKVREEVKIQRIANNIYWISEKLHLDGILRKVIN